MEGTSGFFFRQLSPFLNQENTDNPAGIWMKYMTHIPLLPFVVTKIRDNKHHKLTLCQMYTSPVTPESKQLMSVT
jgi:hypothetical protein